MTWLDLVVEQHKEYETPLEFWYWAALASISAVVKDNVYLPRAGLYDSYPNIYVILHADSGLKKGPPISMAAQLVKEINNTHVIAGRSSIQGIMKLISEAKSDPKSPSGIKHDPTCFICASELSSSLVEDKASLDILTDIYDRSYRHADYESILKMEFFSLKKPNFVILGGINDAHSEVFFSKKDVNGGFIARTFIVHENKRNTVNALIDKPSIVPNYKALATYLREVSKLRGGFEELSTSSPVGKLYSDWYHEFVKQVELSGLKDATGTLNRHSESVMKVAMLISLSQKPELTISLSAMEQAIDRCSKLIGNVRRTTLGAGKSSFAEHKKLLILELLDRSNHTITREQLNNKYYMHASHEEWDKICEQLEIAGAIRAEITGNVITYVMREEQVDVLKKYFRGK